MPKQSERDGKDIDNTAVASLSINDTGLRGLTESKSERITRLLAHMITLFSQRKLKLRLNGQY